MTKKCNDYKIVINSFWDIEREKERELAKETVAINEDRKEINVWKEEVARYK